MTLSLISGTAIYSPYFSNCCWCVQLVWAELAGRWGEESELIGAERYLDHVEPKAYYTDSNENSGSQLDNVVSPIYEEEWKPLLLPLVSLCPNSVVYMEVFLLHLPYLHFVVFVLIYRKMWTRSSICFPQCLMRMKVYSWMIILECLPLHRTWWIRKMKTSRNLIRCTVSTHHLPILWFQYCTCNAFNETKMLIALPID